MEVKAAETAKAVDAVKSVKTDAAATEMKAFATGNVISLAEICNRYTCNGKRDVTVQQKAELLQNSHALHTSAPP